jgi:dTMP kinase
MFITLEGGEGSGKSTQINLLRAALEAQGHKVITTREPGGTLEAEKIRSLLVQRDGGAWTPQAEALLLFAARHMHLETLIKPALKKGQIVISDRFTDSTRAYQGYAMGLSQENIENVKRAAIGDFEPDLTLILDIDPREGLKRSNTRLQQAHESGLESKAEIEDRYERLGLSFHQKLREGYLEIARQNRKRCKVIDATDTVEALHDTIYSLVKSAMTATEKGSKHG